MDLNKSMVLILFAWCISASGLFQSAAEQVEGAEFEPGIHVVTLGVSDLQKSFTFYKEGLGFPTKMTPDGGIVLFTTSGAKLFLFPYADLARTSGVDLQVTGNPGSGFSGFTLGHGVLTREEVDRVLTNAEKAGGKIVKPAHEVAWGAYVGYFSDPDGYLWEVAYSEHWSFSPEGVMQFRD